MASSPARKKQKKTKTVKFSLTISSHAILKSVCDVLDSLVSTFQFVVVQNENFQGLKVRQMDDGLSSLTSVRYACQVECPHGQSSFMVAKTMFRAYLGQNAATAVLKILQYEGEDCIHFFSLDDDHNCTDAYSCSLLDWEGPDEDEADDLVCEHTLEMDLTILGRFLKLSQTGPSSADDVRFKLLQHKGSKEMLFQMAYQQTANMRGSRLFKFHGDQQVNHEDIDFDDYAILYSQSFSVDFLRRFIKHLDKDRKLTIGLQEDKPLCVNYNLGVEKSVIRFYLAPKVDDMA